MAVDVINSLSAVRFLPTGCHYISHTGPLKPQSRCPFIRLIRVNVEGQQMFSWLPVSPLVGQQVLIVRFIVSMLLLYVSIMHFFMFFRACIAFFPWWKKQTNGKLLSAGWLSGSSGGEGGREEWGTQRGRAVTAQPERKRRRRDVSCASCHAIHLLSIQRDGGPACCLLLPNKVKHNKLRAQTFFRSHLQSAPLPGPICGSFWFWFFSVDFFPPFFIPLPTSIFWGECVVFLEDRYVIFTNY